MLTTVTGEGALHARPMTLNEHGDDGALWFIFPLDSETATDAQANAEVNVAVEKGDNRFVSIAGTAVVVRDKAKLKERWSPFADAWFPGGVEDTNAALLKVEPSTAEYWELNTPKPVRMLQMLRSAVTKSPPNDLGDGGTLQLNG